MTRTLLAPALAPAISALILAPHALAQTRYDFSAVTALAQDALAGRNVDRPVPGFELMLLKDGVTVYKQAFGLWAPDQAGNADSATKTLSGAVIASLTDHAARPFSLDTRLSELIPAFSGVKSSITVRQCFSHTAGFGNTNAESDPGLTLQQAALQIAGEPLRHLPGAVFDYTGTGMHAAGAAGELAGGAPWVTLFEQRVTGPLGLAHTRFVLTTPANPRIAGGCESNAADFCRFMEMLRRSGEIDGRRILSPAAVAMMLTRQTPQDIPVFDSPLEGSADYGVGVWLDRRHPDGSLEGAQAAGARGFSSWIDFDDGIVGTFATDLTLGQNIRGLVNLLRDAAQDAVRHPLPCPADFNADGFLDFFDYDGFTRCFEGGDGGGGVACPPGTSADFNADGFVDFFDYDAFVQAFEAGC